MKKVVLVLAVMAVVAGGAFAEFGGGLSAPSSDLRVAEISEFTVTVEGEVNGKAVKESYKVAAETPDDAKKQAIEVFSKHYPKATGVVALACGSSNDRCFF